MTAQRIVITGTSTGIGRVLTEHLLSRGHQVWGLARTPQADLAHERFRWSTCDVSVWEEVAQVAAEVRGQWAGVHALVTCAGVQGEIGPATQVDPQRWSATVRTNLDGTFFAIRAFAEQLLTAPQRAKVVCFSGGGATKSRPNFSAYGVAKTGVVRLVETLAEEWQGSSIDINAVAPGAIATRLTDEVIALGPTVVGAAEYASAVKQKASGTATPAKAVALVEWLLSSSSDGITGRLLSAPWDPWDRLDAHVQALATSDVYTLRRVVPEERGFNW